MIKSTLCYIENSLGGHPMLRQVKKKNNANHGKHIGTGGKFEDIDVKCVRKQD